MLESLISQIVRLIYTDIVCTSRVFVEKNAGPLNVYDLCRSCADRHCSSINQIMTSEMYLQL